MKKLSIHHWWWPKHKFPWKNMRKVQVKVDIDTHQDYHNFFVHNCRRQEMRRCRVESCAYEGLCCYFGTELTF